MRNITEMFENSRTIQEQINESRIDEGLKDLFQTVKEKFKKLADKVVAYLKYVCVKAGTYFIPVDNNGELMEAISPLTMGQAMKDGKIDKKSTFIFMDKEGSKLTGFKSNLKDAAKLYGLFGQDAIAYWEYCVTKFESANGDQANINEVKLGSEDPEALYSKICDNKELKEEIKWHITDSNAARLMIWGAPGIGKTAILNSVLEELGKDFKDYKLIVKTLSNETPDNFTLPDYVDINGERKATDIPKTWLPVYKPSGDAKRDQMLDEACGKGLLFIDELSRATPQVLNVILPLINEGVFNGYKLGSGWSIVVASNREEDEMAGQTPIGSALGNRFAHVYYEPTVKSWREWADKQGFMSPLLLEWLSMADDEEFSGGKFYYWDPNSEKELDSSSRLICTPRSWTNAMRDLARYNHTLEGNLQGFAILDIPERILARTLNKYVPATAIGMFLNFLNVIRGIGNLDAAVESVWKKGGKGLKIDARTLNKVALPLSQLVICQRGSKTLPSTKEFESLCSWLVDSNSDRLASYVLDIVKNVFFNSLADNMRDKAFLLNKTYKLSSDDEKRNLDLIYKPILSAYGLKSCDDMPDYTPGLRLIRDKYKEIFKASTINGKEALG